MLTSNTSTNSMYHRVCQLVLAIFNRGQLFTTLLLSRIKVLFVMSSVGSVSLTGRQTETPSTPRQRRPKQGDTGPQGQHNYRSIITVWLEGEQKVQIVRKIR